MKNTRHGEPIVVTPTPSVLVDTLVIAAAIASIAKHYGPDSDTHEWRRFIGVSRSAEAIADAIQPTDGAFDRQAFLKLCGVVE